ncbi:3-hydroxyacyl-CoA dehydrogenase family protein [Croceicoccus ponticola]|uniref:3-hydroxyacyl-CoA dehydrogenase family protein n=1 Tax=Croceicoccus ponticola TaxID=2217664 RepID=A0A437GUG5_9SPHN|nr:3-hydroxyacyl-CoA dehydrogenase family protein [Croceicoccus ponticola]RVQ65018.1 3-hydroxyacyl-CoA dehydrogenase family protein [Croceicoccus ponticola]
MNASQTTWSTAVLGGGTMGVGIVYVCAQAGGQVWLVEPDDARAKAVKHEIGDAVASAINRGKMTEPDADELPRRITRLKTVDDIPENLDLVIETVPERLAIKKDVLARAAARKPHLLATNTSAISIDLLAADLPEPAKFLGMHFFNPVWSIKLLEIVRGAATSDHAIEQARTFARWIGKESLTVSDVPGFATSRLDLIASLEAMRMVESGVASAEDIDRAAVVAYRHPVGPLRLSDIVGLDVRLDIARTLEAAHGSRFAPPAILERMVAEGKLGAKSGEGFFAWTD